MKKTSRTLWILVALSVLITAIAVPLSAEVTTIDTQKPTAEAFVLPDIVKGEQGSELYTARVKEQETNLNTLVFEKQDGALEMRLFDHPVKYVDEKGETKDITTDVKPTADGGYQTAQNAVVTTFSKNLNDGITLKKDSIHIKMVPISGTKQTATVTAKDEKTLSYAYGDKTSLEYSLTYMGYKEDIVVQEYTGQTEYSFLLYTNGLRVVRREESFYLADAKGDIKATIGDIIIFTADERNNTLGGLTSETIKENQIYRLTIHVDADYLKDPKTAYPIRIDPTIEVSAENNSETAIDDVTIYSNSGSNGASGSLLAGIRTTRGKSRILMRFPGLDLDLIGSAKRIKKATVNMRDLMCETTALTIHSYIFIGDAWTEETANWSNLDVTHYRDRQSSQTVSYDNGLNKNPAHTYKFNITQAVKEWKAGNTSANKNKGVVFKAANAVEADNSEDRYKTFGSYNRASYKPSLTVEYYGSRIAIVAIEADGADRSSFFENVSPFLEDKGYDELDPKVNTYIRESRVAAIMDAEEASVFISRSHGGPIFDANDLSQQLGTCILLSDEHDTNPSYLMSTSFPDVDLSNLELAMFVGCCTGSCGANGNNLPYVAVQHGAKVAIGFKTEINTLSANAWTKAFLKALSEGETISGARTIASRASGVTDTRMQNIANIVVYGDLLYTLC